MAEHRKIVVVGGVAAGPKAAARARRLDPHADITIVEKDSILSYAGCGLPYYISGMVEDRRDLMATGIGVLRDPAFFAKVKNIKALTLTEATAIHRQEHELEVRDLKSGEVGRLPYDKLILATGADPISPPIPGADLGRVLRLKQLEDADVFRELLAANACPQVTIIGGGPIGLEMTEAMVHRGRAVTIVEMLPHVLTMIDADMAHLLEKRMRELGVRIMTSTRVERLEGDEEGNVAKVVTSAGEVPAQLVLLSIGIRPNVGLALDAGLLIGPSGAIHVNEYMQTSDPDIFAAGDCAEKACVVAGVPCFLPLGSVANKEGRVAGSNAAGYNERFAGVTSTAAAKVFDWNVGRAGMSTAQAKTLGIPTVSATVAGGDKPHYYPDSKGMVLRLIADARDRRLLGIQGVGMGEVIKRVDVAVTALTAGMTVDDVADLDLAYAPPYSEAMDLLAHGANTLRNKLDGLVRMLNAGELKARLSAGEAPFLLDVRTPDEYAAGRLAGSVLVPLGALAGRAAEVPRDRPVVAYCKTSLRAYEAARILAGLGYDNVEVLEGGVMAWPYELESG
jgi:NADPH-dependent 2,4-dienoyl-CoA reductase/sulfur reductase-like enzyme/rhodanese-related sulfurtransferase